MFFSFLSVVRKVLKATQTRHRLRDHIFPHHDQVGIAYYYLRESHHPPLKADLEIIS